MPSPFPGMDPYLEAPDGWGGVHHGLIYQIHAELNRVLPEGYVASIDEYLWVEETDTEERARLGKPDVFIPESRRPSRGRTAVLAGSVTEPTTRGNLPRSRKRKNRFVRISTARGQGVWTVIEVLSPSNKGADEDRDAYMQKRREYLATVNLLEIDLLRAGTRVPMGRPEPPVSDYYVFSCRYDEYHATATWAFSFRDPIPSVLVPVNKEIGDVPLNLADCLHRVYDVGRYSDKIDYSESPTPPLDRHDAEWAAELLAKHTKKKKR